MKHILDHGISPRARRGLGSLLSCGMVAAVAFCSQGAGRSDEAPEQGGKVVRPPDGPLDRLEKDARVRPAAEIASALRAVAVDDLSNKDRERWARLARETAVRLGDRAWIEDLKPIPDSFSLVRTYAILGASAKVREGDYEGAREDLKKVGDPKRLNAREERRVEAIHARIAQLLDDAPGEREAVERLVDHLWRWPSPSCQSCHDDFKKPGQVPLLDISNLWFGDRFVALMKAQGDAEEVVRAAARSLERDPKNDKARIRLAYGLRALGRAEEAEKRFRELPWASFPDRLDGAATPRMMTIFP
jgi:tetratricopeptide (TPR) repeat protein